MKKLLVAAIIAAATPAFAGGLGDLIKKKNPPQATQPITQPGVPANQANADEAKKALDVIEVDLQASKLYLVALWDLASKPATWDRAHSVTLFNDAERAVTEAEEHIGKIEPMAKDSWAKAADPIGKARASLVQTQAQLRSFASGLRGGNFAGGDANAIKGLWTTVDTAQKQIEGAAGAMGVDFHLKSF